VRTRRLAVAGVVWVAALAVGRGALALPEGCPTVTVDQARAAATAAVGWFAANQLPDGRWIYRYDRETGTADDYVHTVREAAAPLGLYQAAGAGIDGALAVADKGAAFSLDHVYRHDDWEAVASGGDVPTGATALLVAGLAARITATGDAAFHHDDLQALGRFLVAMVEPDGSVSQGWDPSAGRRLPPGVEIYHTGETFFALSALAAGDPEGPWLTAAQRVGHYITTERDRVESRFPPSSDHWAAYALAQLHAAGVPLTADEQRYATRLAEIFGIQVRYESQRTDHGLNVLLRGREALPSGLGTLGEGLAAVGRLPGADPAIPARVRCTAGMLVSRQSGPADAARDPHPERVNGAWFHAGFTQMDDQQHTLSAILAAVPSLTTPGQQPPTGGASLPRLVWLAVIALAAVNPFRVRLLIDEVDRRDRIAGAALGAAALAAVASVAGWLLRVGDVSAPTVAIAAGLLLAVEGVVDAIRGAPEPIARGPGAPPWLVPVTFPALLRVGPALVVLAVAATHGVGPGLLVAVVVGAAALAPRPSPRLAGHLVRLAGAVAVVGAIDLILHGVFAV
jgi:hypothetical protein